MARIPSFDGRTSQAERNQLNQAPRGALGLSFDVAGPVTQAIGDALIDRGHDRALVIDALKSPNFDEGLFWDQHGGRICDALEAHLGLDSIDLYGDGEETTPRPLVQP